MDNNKQMRSIGWAVIIIFVILITVGLSIYSYQSKSRSSHTKRSAPLPVSVMQAKQQNSYYITREFIGTIVTARTSDLSFELHGLLMNLYKDEGDVVTKGEVIAKLDTEKLELKKKALLAQKQALVADFDLASLTRKRREQLLTSNHVSKQQYDEAKFHEQALKAKIEQTEANIRDVEVDLAKSKLHAPYSGVISHRYLDEGVVIQPGQRILQIMEVNQLEIRVGIPIQFVKHFKIGSRYQIKIENKTYVGKLTRILPNVASETQTVTMVFKLAKPITVSSGEVVRLTIKQKVHETGFWVPIDALTSSLRGLWSVYIATPLKVTNKAKTNVKQVKRAEVEVLYNENGKAFVRGTLTNGDLIITGGTHRVVPGQEIEIIKQK